MDGDVAPLAEIGGLARAHDAILIVDDAHATGILGEGGRGLSDEADIVIGTFSKALGGFGAYVACSQTVRDYLINRCTGLIYSTALPPPVLGAIDAALDLLPALDAERARVARLAERFRRGARALGYDTGASATQIVPLIAGSDDAALALSETLRAAGFWATAIRPPTVPAGTARVRLAFTAAHRRRRRAFARSCSKRRRWSASATVYPPDANAFRARPWVGFPRRHLGEFRRASRECRRDPGRSRLRRGRAEGTWTIWPERRDCASAIRSGCFGCFTRRGRSGRSTSEALVSIQGFDRFCPHIPPSRVARMRRGLAPDPAGPSQAFWRACGTRSPSPPLRPLTSSGSTRGSAG